MKIYELAASKNSPMYGAVLGRFTSERAANEAFKKAKTRKITQV